MPLTKENVRKLARVVQIDEVVEHPNADKLEIALVGGWQCVVAIDEFKSGDKAIYCEVDSALPVANPLFGFLNSRHNDIRKDENETVYCQIRSIKLRGEVSQGLLIPCPPEYADTPVEFNLTEALGVLKWVKTQEDVIEEIKKVERWPEKVARFIRGKDEPSIYMPWPESVTKSDQERIQNLPAMHRRAVETEETFEKTQKLNGQSVTLISDLTGVRIANRNNELRTEPVPYDLVYSVRLYLANLFLRIYRFFTTGYWSFPKWKTSLEVKNDKAVNFFLTSGIAKKIKAFHKLKGDLIPVVFQGELCGPGINGDYEQLGKYRFFVYNVYTYDADGNQIELKPETARIWAKEAGLEYVPVLEEQITLHKTIREIVLDSEGKSSLNKNVKREGVVYKSNKTGLSFKVISESFALKEAKEND